MKTSRSTTARLTIAAMVTALAAGGALAQHAGHGGGGDAGKMGAGHRMGGKGMHGGGHAMGPGAVMEMCDGKDSMPPHYCAPHYHVMSSVPGAAIAGAQPMGDQMLMVTLRLLPGAATPALAIVGGGGELAGAVTVAAGWKDGTTVHLALTGEGSLYRQRGVHLHLFPLTGK